MLVKRIMRFKDILHPVKYSHDRRTAEIWQERSQKIGSELLSQMFDGPGPYNINVGRLPRWADAKDFMGGLAAYTLCSSPDGVTPFSSIHYDQEASRLASTHPMTPDSSSRRHSVLNRELTLVFVHDSVSSEQFEQAA